MGKHRILRRWPVAAGIVFAFVAAVLLFGLTGRFVVALILLGSVGVSTGVLRRLRSERAAHRSTLARRDAQEAALAERLRLARDLHDLVSHGLGLITVRSAAAVHVHARTSHPDTLLDALRDVEEISRTTTVELRRMLDALRERDDAPANHPAQTLAALPDIVAGARRSGLDVDLRHEEMGAVSPGVQLAICRVVREGLANSAHHAGATHVVVHLSRTPEAVRVTVTDEGPVPGWTPRPGAGHGLLGLRERVTTLSGTLTAGPRNQPHDNGFQLEASLPDPVA